ncbi:MAG: YkgJ family cysteine cluster protein [Proteobacteria bacterium]|nr:YkgJ family cysteine cluster protein [Pseudomonadota bacterium]
MTSSCTCCGACCATYRVVFSLDETDQMLDAGVPAELTLKLNSEFCCMCGTDTKPQRCVALVGQVGKSVSCSIYARRPSPCRAFAPEAAGGHGDIACGNARRQHGLAPLAGSYDAVPFA